MLLTQTQNFLTRSIPYSKVNVIVGTIIWEVVQRQDTGLWLLVSGFESLPPSILKTQNAKVKSATQK